MAPPTGGVFTATPATQYDSLRAAWLVEVAATLRVYLDSWADEYGSVSLSYDGPQPLTVPLWSDHTFRLQGPGGEFVLTAFFRGDDCPKYIHGITTLEGVVLTPPEVTLVMGCLQRDPADYDWPTGPGR